MNTKPSDIPALPEGAVYLGKGGEFSVPQGAPFSGWCAEQEVGFGDWYRGWYKGNSRCSHYAAPRDSEVARLNGFEADGHLYDEMDIQMPDLDEEGLELMKQQARVLGPEIEIVRLRKELTDTQARLSEAVRLGDALASSASSVCCVNGPDDYRLSVKRLSAWEAFKASSLKG